jgi:[ribosomal protein S18]-alanine N-acetyltransferase
MLQMRLLPMAMGDLDDVMAIENISHLAPWSRGNFTDSLTAGYWAYCLRELAEDDEREPLLAYCVLMPGVDELNLLNITVNPIYRRRGLAKKVLEAMESLAIGRDLYKIFLEVRISNINAIGLYEGLGYRQIGVRKEYYPARDGIREDAKVMVKELKKE